MCNPNPTTEPNVPLYDLYGNVVEQTFLSEPEEADDSNEQ